MIELIQPSVGLHTQNTQTQNQKTITVLSLFDGISCGRLALQKANIPVGTYYASEIKRSAIRVTQHHFPDTKQLGDVTKIDFTQFRGKIDLLLAGSPCVDFSTIPGSSHQGIAGEQSSLLLEFIRAINECAPRYFLLENVVMKKTEQEKINTLLGVEPIEINSALVSFQNRRRLYWTNIPNITLPADKGISFQDVMDTDPLYCQNFLLSKTDYHERMCGTRPIRAGQFNCKCDNVTHKDKVGTLKRTASFPMSLVECSHNLDGYCQFRELTTRERELAQTLPVGYLSMCSKSQARDLTGDGWTIDVITHIFSFLKQALEQEVM